MSKSYREIDYRLRPAKNVERKMLAEAFGRLSRFARVDFYRYVGMGSLYFSDFILFHRALGFREMISIEKEENATIKERFDFNKPFNCVDIKFGSASSILPNLSWDAKNIVWLDYNGKLNKEILADTFLVVSQIALGSIFLISVNSKILEITDNTGKPLPPVEALENAIGKNKVPVGTTKDNLTGWKLAEIYRQIITNEIEDALNERNVSLPVNERIQYQQLFNFHYEDDAKMLTMGGIFYTEDIKSTLDECAFQELDFYRSDEKAYPLGKVPLLTFKEIRALNSCLPFVDDDTEYKKSLPPISEEDKNKYARLYRYYPTFAETDV
jgi:hypothetical protein